MVYATPTFADTYTWDFGDGSPTQSGTTASHTFATAGPHQVCLTVLYPNGCTRTQCQTTSFVSVQDDDLRAANVFPNPANDIISISLPVNIQKAQYDLLDLSGKTIAQGTITDSAKNISVQNLARGVYLVRLYHQRDSRTFRIVLQ
jgi:PKD repeat protein